MIKLPVLLLICVAVNRVKCANIQCDPLENPKLEEICEGNYPLGVSTGSLPDSAFSASSSFDVRMTGPQNARLNQDLNGGGWCPNVPISKGDYSQYINVDLKKRCIVKSIRTQGRYARGNGKEYAPFIHVQYLRNGSWVRYCNPMTLNFGNNDTTSITTNQFQPWIDTSNVRITPVIEGDPMFVCLRTGFTGCCFEDVDTIGSKEVITNSTTALPGVTNSTEVSTIPEDTQNKFWEFLLTHAWIFTGVASSFLTGLVIYLACFYKKVDNSVPFHVPCEDPSEGINLLPIGQIPVPDIESNHPTTSTTL